MINKELDEEEAELRSIRQSEIDSCKNAIAAEEGAQADASACADIITAKKEAVGLQLEAVYRSRLQDAHQQVRSDVTVIVFISSVSRLRNVWTTSWRRPML